METMDLSPGKANVNTDILENLGDGVCKTAITHSPSTYSAQTLGLDLAALLSFQPLLSLLVCFLIPSFLLFFHIS